MKFSKVLKFGCLGAVGLVVLLMIVGLIGQALMTPEEKAKMAAQRQAAEAKATADEKAAEEKTLAQQKQGADDLVRKLTLLRRCLPPAEQLQEVRPSANAKIPEVTYTPADYAFVTQFAETGFVPLAHEDPHLWYRGTVFDDVQKALTSTDLSPEKRNAALAGAAAAFDAKPFVVVFMPLDQAWPEMGTDNKKFVSGYFRGWLILLDAKKQEIISQTMFEAENSPKVTNTRLKVVGVPVGSGIGGAIASDFTDNFWKAANAAIDKTLPPK